jgi:hypothetical protein
MVAWQEATSPKSHSIERVVCAMVDAHLLTTSGA